MSDKILLTIAARGGSKGVKNKNIRELCGKPLIAHTILQAKWWGKADKIICTTDSLDISRVAREYGAEVPFLRPPELATDTAGKLDALRHALKSMETLTEMQFSVIVDLDPTAPIRKVSDIECAYQLFLQKKANCVFSVVPCRKNPYFNMVELNAEGFTHLVKTLPVPLLRRQDAPKVFDANASIYIYDREFLLKEETNSVVGARSAVWVMDDFAAFDIDTELDFQFIEFLVEKKLIEL